VSTKVPVLDLTAFFRPLPLHLIEKALFSEKRAEIVDKPLALFL
jgi:hypothetical protein